MNDINWKEFHSKKLAEIPEDFLQEAVEYLHNKFESEQDVKEILLKAIKQDPDMWWVNFHHGWGTDIRNSLRQGGFTDDKLPDQNWDDYYIPVVELAISLEEFNKRKYHRVNENDL